jgi:hypothetical protein
VHDLVDKLQPGDQREGAFNAVVVDELAPNENDDGTAVEKLTPLLKGVFLLPPTPLMLRLGDCMLPGNDCL